MAEADVQVLFLLKCPINYFLKMKNTFHQHFIRIHFCYGLAKDSLQNVSAL